MIPLTACFRMGIECAGFPRAATVWRINASSVGAAVKRRGRQRAPTRNDVTRTSPIGRGVVPDLAAQCRDRHAAGRRRRAVSDRQRAGERMNSSGAVENRELIGVVRRTRVQPCLHERRLAGEAGAGHDDGAVFPADNTSVYEEVVRRALRDEGLRVCCQRPPDIRQPAHFRDKVVSGIQAVAGPRTCRNAGKKLVSEGHGGIGLVVFDRAPPERQVRGGWDPRSRVSSSARRSTRSSIRTPYATK